MFRPTVEADATVTWSDVPAQPFTSIIDTLYLPGLNPVKVFELTYEPTVPIRYVYGLTPLVGFIVTVPLLAPAQLASVLLLVDVREKRVRWSVITESQPAAFFNVWV